MSVIDLDKRIKVDNESTVKLAGKEYKIVFNDAFNSKVTDIGTKISTIFDHLDSDEFNDDLKQMNDKERKDTINKLVNEIRDTAINGLDDLLGKGVGKTIYDYYHQSTDAVSAVIQSLIEASDNAVHVKKARNRQERRAKYRTER